MWKLKAFAPNASPEHSFCLLLKSSSPSVFSASLQMQLIVSALMLMMPVVHPTSIANEADTIFLLRFTLSFRRQRLHLNSMNPRRR